MKKTYQEVEDNYVCDICEDTGEVRTDVWNEDAHTYEPTGTEKCECRF